MAFGFLGSNLLNIRPLRLCGKEEYFDAAISKRMDTAFHDVFDHQKPPQRMLQIPSVTL